MLYSSLTKIDKENWPVEVVDDFYATLFSNHPEAQELFPVDDMDTHKRKIVQFFAFVLQNLEGLDLLYGEFFKMGKRHVSYSTPIEYYPVVKDHLVGSFNRILVGEKYEEQRNDWKDLVSLIVDHMKEGALEVAPSESTKEENMNENEEPQLGPEESTMETSSAEESSTQEPILEEDSGIDSSPKMSSPSEESSVQEPLLEEDSGVDSSLDASTSSEEVVSEESSTQEPLVEEDPAAVPSPEMNTEETTIEASSEEENVTETSEQGDNSMSEQDNVLSFSGNAPEPEQDKVESSSSSSTLELPEEVISKIREEVRSQIKDLIQKEFDKVLNEEFSSLKEMSVEEFLKKAS